MRGFLLHRARLSTPEEGRWLANHSLWVSSRSGAVSTGLDVRDVVPELELDELVDESRARRQAGDGVRLRVSESAVVAGTAAVRDRLELTGAGGAPFVRIELFWIDSGEAWRAWGVAPAAGTDPADEALVGFVDALAAGSVRAGRSDPVWTEAKEAWSEVTSWY